MASRVGFPASSDETKTDRNYETSIFIGNVPFSSTREDIARLFGDYQVVHADIVKARGRSKGMATVEFASKQEVQRAIEQFDQADINGRKIFVRQDYAPREQKSDSRDYTAPSAEPVARPERRAKTERRPAKESGEGIEVFVGNLPYTTSWQDLKDLMRSVGSVARADIGLDFKGRSRGYGTVIFDDARDADRAVEKFNGYAIQGRNIEVRIGHGPSAPPERAERRPVNKNTPFTDGVTGNGPVSNTIYTENLPFITTVDDLYELFETVGTVAQAEIQFEERGRPSGNAVVQFEADELADLAIKNLHGYNYGGRDLRISFAQKPADFADSADVEIADAEPQTQSEPQPEPVTEDVAIAEP